MQVEYATDVVFRRQATFQPLYEAIVRTAVHVIKADHVATFLGHKLNANFQGEVGNDFSTRIQGTRIRHHMGPASLKLYDKAGIIARVECTANDVSFFKHHRHVEQRNGERVFKLAPLRKSIYSLGDLRQLMHAANDRYLAFMACLDNPDAAQKALAKMAAPAKVKGRSYRGFDLFLDPDYQLFLTLARGEWSISGFRAGDLRSPHPRPHARPRLLPDQAPAHPRPRSRRWPTPTSTSSPSSAAASSSPRWSSASTSCNPASSERRFELFVFLFKTLEVRDKFTHCDASTAEAGADFGRPSSG